MLPDFGATGKEAMNFHQHLGILCDYFKGHSAELVKDFTLVPSCRENLTYDIMKGRLTPVGQYLETVLNKVFKGYLRDLDEISFLTSPVNPRTGNQYPLPRQLLET